MEKKVPITRLGKFFEERDFDLDLNMGEEWLHGDLNMRVVLYKVDRKRTKKDDVYGESMEDGIVFHPPVELHAFLEVVEPDNSTIASSRVSNMEPGNMKFHVYHRTLDELGVSIDLGDYIAYYEKEDLVRYYTVVNDGRVVSDNKHTYGGYKSFYRTYLAAAVTKNEFRGK